MKGRIPFAVLFAIALTIVSLLPLYVERTMTELMFADGSGGAIRWGWKRCSLREYWADYRHMDREQDPAFWLSVDAALALAYASAIAIPLHRVTRRRF